MAAIRVPGPVERAFLPDLAAVMARAGDEPVGLEALAVSDRDGPSSARTLAGLGVHRSDRISWIAAEQSRLTPPSPPTRRLLSLLAALAL